MWLDMKTTSFMIYRVTPHDIRPAVLDCMWDDAFEMWRITRINVPKLARGRGVARDMLKELTDRADRERMTLCLDIAPSDGLDYEALRQWYERHGFETHNRIPTWFRLPLTPA